ncbi:hydroxyethylthiazole kinase [Neisseria wadsworthii]|uniref:Hydroxyethylthiazole kinase n=1 Tax=Neisseria wadsworthii 9715 TaxID=1030841 RepID=G4CLY4_9NEIS|nr:hydroxyethylthiazole kinase [Neisseria wadsworthii]EGZ51342.1 hydroxyethylthiazole kinase [Neisseria wadsworthii 9715]QMT36159.1 hydroxyethylthiazole kinase [Neisseria wadsworthii]
MIMISVADMAAAVRRRNPLVHNITNYVAAPFQANALSAVGASPIMADAVEEAAEMTGLADALVINLGTLNRYTIAAMQLSMQAAADKGIPVVFDPVGVGATAFRRETALSLLAQYPVNIIRANAGEIAELIGVAHQNKGIDAGSAPKQALELARQAAERYRCTIAMTGATDYITNGTETYACRNGHPMMAALVGTGCTSSSVTAAFAATHPENLTAAAAAALAYYGLCGQTTAAAARGPGSLQAELLDALYTLPESAIRQGCLLEALS